MGAILRILRDHGDVMAAVEIARRANLDILQAYAELNAAEARGLVRILPIDGRRHLYGWAAV